MEDWINEIYDELNILFKIKNPIPLELIESDNLYGYVASKRYIIEQTNTLNKRVKNKIITTKYCPYAIRLAGDWVEVSYNKMRDHLLPFAVRTLIHEIVHYKIGKSYHSKSFYREYFKLCVKYCGHKLNISKSEVMADKDLLEYINRYVLD